MKLGLLQNHVKGNRKGINMSITAVVLWINMTSKMAPVKNQLALTQISNCASCKIMLFYVVQDIWQEVFGGRWAFVVAQ